MPGHPRARAVPGPRTHTRRVSARIHCARVASQGAISHNECLALYKKYVDPAFTWKNFTVQEQDLILKVRAR